jgi:hypothetical protein
MKARPRLPENQNFYINKYGTRWTAMPAWGNIMADSELRRTKRINSMARYNCKN